MGESIMTHLFKQSVRSMIRLVFIFWSLMLASSSYAVIEFVEFSTVDERDRYRVLIDELRCPKCQNQNLADSDAQIAIDLRSKVRELMEQGKTDEEIKTHLVARYGDFVLYRPEVKKETYVLWFAPAVLLFIGLIVVIAVMVRNRKPSEVDAVSFGSDEERQAKLRKLMEGSQEK
jgi:cytochrome c-type biogenesis protein CcmH